MIASAGCILLTAIRATLPGLRWARAQMSAISFCKRSRLDAMDMIFTSVRASERLFGVERNGFACGAGEFHG
jgi:hypothetical protein